MKFFINKDKEVYSYSLEDKIIKLYQNDNLILSSETRLNNVSLPVSPFYISGNLFIFDYDKGIEIINSKNRFFIKVLAAYRADIINNYLLAFKQKKLVIINYLTGTIINEYNLSENFEFRKSDEYALFYRFKRNHSYLYHIKNKTIVELKEYIKYNVLLKLMSTKKRIYLFGFSDGIWGITIYDTMGNKLSEENFEGNYSVLGWHYLNDLEFPIDDSIKINYDNYGEIVYSLYKKYGIFLALYFSNEEKINSLKMSEYHWIYECYFEYKEFMDHHRNVSSDAEFKEIELELIKLANIFKEHKITK